MKNLFLDVETTGLKPDKHSIVQLAMIIDVNGQMKDKRVWNIQPIPEREIEQKALEVTGLTLETLQTYTPYKEAMNEIILWLNNFINPYDKADRAYPIGYNVGFDMDFLRAYFETCGNMQSFWGYIGHRRLDVLQWVYTLDYVGKLKLPNYKLGTVCDKYNVSIKAHDPLSDILATRELFYILSDTLNLGIKKELPQMPDLFPLFQDGRKL